MENKNENEITAIIESKKDNLVVAIVEAKHWFKNVKFSFPVSSKDLVVCQWFNFNDGVNNHPEAKQTIAICKQLSDAEKIFNIYK